MLGLKLNHVNKGAPDVFLGYYIDGLVQDCSNSSALAMELLQSCTEQSIYSLYDDPRKNYICKY